VADELALPVLGRHVDDQPGILAGHGQGQDDGKLIEMAVELPPAPAQLLGHGPGRGPPGAG